MLTTDCWGFTMDWDLTSYFPQFGGVEFITFKDNLERDISSLKERASTLNALDGTNQRHWERCFVDYEELMTRLSHLGSYIACLGAADSRNEAYRREEAALGLIRAEFSKIRLELLRCLKDATANDFKALEDSQALEHARHYLNRMREEAGRNMSLEKETLAADLGVNGLQAWGRLYNNVTGQLEFTMVYPDGRQERVPISQRRSLMDNPDRAVRKAAFENGNAAWESVECTIAAILNAISGTRLTLNKHRAVEHFLDVALFQAGITRKTLDAMFEAIFNEIDIARAILRLKAKLLNQKGVAWYDLGAPMQTADAADVSWEKATHLVQSAFGRTYPRFAEFFQGIVAKKWIDWQPRPGKRPGGFCTGSLLTRESRIFMTFNKTMGDVTTLAHESGHAFHSYNLHGLRPYARTYPMTLAETASTFGEMVLMDALLKDHHTSDAERTYLLDLDTGRGAIFLLDIPVRYEFEKTLYEERARGELSVTRLKELMVDTQQHVLGDVLLEGGEDPYFWASKLHFYITGVTFYNFPYTFGFLLSRALFAQFRKEGPDFLPKYESFLKLSGSDSPETVVRQTLGQDLESPDFWAEAIVSLTEPMRELASLVAKRGGEKERRGDKETR
jgi:oligoendopeptidase F